MLNTPGQEQITKQARLFGNGAHIFVPREWAGQEIILIKKEEPLEKRIMKVIEPHLPIIKGVYLYGSRARGEFDKSSDIDLFIITSKDLKLKVKDFEIVCMKEEDIEKNIKFEPLIMYSILREAKSIINSDLLDKLKERYKPKIEDFKEFLESSKRMININEMFLEEDKDSRSISGAVVYSLILRLRGIFIINCLLNKEEHSNKRFINWICSKENISGFKNIYEGYREFKNDKKISRKIENSDLFKLVKLLKLEVEKLEVKIGKKKEKTVKRN